MAVEPPHDRRVECPEPEPLLQIKAVGGTDAERQAVEDATVRLPMDQLVGALNEHVSAGAGHRLRQHTCCCSWPVTRTAACQLRICTTSLVPVL
jgi:hypothetical protein